MINFFRKIRKKLADDNQIVKYSRYAVGEIVLVVIGILIALSINNWNEAKKLSAIEKQLLKETLVKNNSGSNSRLYITTKKGSEFTKQINSVYSFLK